jgi:hypothetical protein
VKTAEAGDLFDRIVKDSLLTLTAKIERQNICELSAEKTYVGAEKICRPNKTNAD